MSKINDIERAIIELEGGRYQKLIDQYVYRKFKYTNFTSFGSHTGTDKTTKGTPDSYVRTDDGKYIFLMYGTCSDTSSEKRNSFNKIITDIESCLDPTKVNVERNEIAQIICCHTTSNLSVEQNKEINALFKNITLIGINDLANDLHYRYPNLAKDFLSVSVDTNQILEPEVFISENERSVFSTSIEMPLLYREEEKKELLDMLNISDVIVICGQSGVGKTKLALEVASDYARRNNYQIKVIKNKNLSIYEDLQSYFMIDNNYVILVDDANLLSDLEHLMRMVIDPNRSGKLKVLLTVRDYAKRTLLTKIHDVLIPQEYLLKSLDDKKISDIIKKNIGITNNLFLNQIVNIAKGNVRLAIMSGISAKREKNFKSIQNAFEIFDRYYDNIISSMSKEKLIIASLIAFFDSFELNNSSNLIYTVAREYGIDEYYLRSACSELHQDEIVDIYENLAVKFSNQNLCDYLIYYVIFKKKWISIEYIISVVFSVYKHRMIYCFNTMMRLFYSEENYNYLKHAVKSNWNLIKDNDDIAWEYIIAFHNLIEEDSLSYIKSKIDNLEQKRTDFLTFDFKNNSNHHNIKSSLLNVLANYKYSEQFDTALELILMNLEKDSSEPMDYYFILKDILSIDMNSYQFGYEAEYKTICKLYQTYKTTKDSNIAILTIFFAQFCMALDFEETEQSYKKYTISFIRFGVVDCEESIKLRNTCLDILFSFFKDPLYCKFVYVSLKKYSPYKDDNDEINSIVLKDIDIINEWLLKLVDTSNFNECNISYHFYKTCIRLGLEPKESFELWKRNKTFTLYAELKRDYYLHYDSVKKADKERKAKIVELSSQLTTQDYMDLFKCLSEELIENQNNWDLSIGLEILITSINDNSLFLNVIDAYIEYDTPFNIRSLNTISKLILVQGYSWTFDYINEKNFTRKCYWMQDILDLLPDEDINEQKCNEILSEIMNDNCNIESYIINYSTVERINNKSQGFSIRYLKSLTMACKSKQYILSNFLSELCFEYENNTDEIMKLFYENLNIMSDAYLLALQGRPYFDHDGFLLVSLLNYYPDFIDKLLSFIITNDNIDDDVLINLWKADNYKNIIVNAVHYIIENITFDFKATSCLKHLFNYNRQSKDSAEKQKELILWFIDNYYNDEKILNCLFNAIDNWPKKERLSIVLYLCKINDSFDMFKICPILPSSMTWNGSEVPIIEDRINVLEELKDKLLGIRYLDHRQYLDDWILSLQKSKKQVLLKEFLDQR